MGTNGISQSVENLEKSRENHESSAVGRQTRRRSSQTTGPVEAWEAESSIL
jgi:hypothetical protein